MEHMSEAQVDFLLKQPGVTWGFETVETPGPVVNVWLNQDGKGVTVAYLNGNVEALSNVVPLRTGKQAEARTT